MPCFQVLVIWFVSGQDKLESCKEDFELLIVVHWLMRKDNKQFSKILLGCFSTLPASWSLPTITVCSNYFGVLRHSSDPTSCHLLPICYLVGPGLLDLSIYSWTFSTIYSGIHWQVAFAKVIVALYFVVVMQFVPTPGDFLLHWQLNFPSCVM